MTPIVTTPRGPTPAQLRGTAGLPATEAVVTAPTRAIAWAAVLVTGCARLVYLASDRAAFNGDEAVTGIMAQNILHGASYGFYPGQRYGGTVEPYLQALFLLVFRLPQNPLTLRLPQVCLSMATCYLIWQCARRCVPDPRRALVAPVIFAVGPWFNVISGASSLGFYVAGTAAATGALYCALRVMEHDSADGPRRQRGRQLPWVAALGLCSGLALWQTLSTACVVLPALLWAAPAAGASLRSAATWATAGIAGSLPVWTQALTTGNLPLPNDSPPPTSALTRLTRLLGPEFREFIGVSYSHDHGGAPRAVQLATTAGLVLLYCLVLVRRRRQVVALLTFDRVHRHPVDLLLIAPIITLVMFACSPSAWYTGTPRYLFTAYPLFAIALAAIPARISHRAVYRVVAVGLVTSVVALSAGYFRGAVVVPTTRDRDAAFRRVAAELKRSGETRVYADYWTAMPLQYAANRSLDVAVFHGANRFGEMQRSVARAAAPVYVGNILDGSAALIARALTNHGVTYRTRMVDFVEIFSDLSSAVRPSALGL